MNAMARMYCGEFKDQLSAINRDMRNRYFDITIIISWLLKDHALTKNYFTMRSKHTKIKNLSTINLLTWEMNCVRFYPINLQRMCNPIIQLHQCLQESSFYAKDGLEIYPPHGFILNFFIFIFIFNLLYFNKI